MAEKGNGSQPVVERSGANALDSALETRLGDDEARLMRDELRLARDEARIARDEARIATGEHKQHSDRVLVLISVALGGALVLAVTALVVALVALNRDVDAIKKATPGNSVSTASLQDASVTADKLALGSVTTGALANGSVVRSAIGAGAVGTGQLAHGAVTPETVKANSLTGATIAETTLGTVPSARTAASATALGKWPASAYVNGLSTVGAASVKDTKSTKGPVAAHCPQGMRAISGGAAIDGSTARVSIVRSTPRGGTWIAEARAHGERDGAWALVVTAICARGGK